jgi:hypothetical protein
MIRDVGCPTERSTVQAMKSSRFRRNRANPLFGRRPLSVPASTLADRRSAVAPRATEPGLAKEIIATARTQLARLVVQ